LQPFQQDQVGISPSMNGIRAEEWTYWKYWNKMNHVHPSQSRFLLQSARVTSLMAETRLSGVLGIMDPQQTTTVHDIEEAQVWDVRRESRRVGKAIININ
jgi:hypothetical protein